MDELQAFALGTLRMDPETFLWSTWRELNAMVRGYERSHRAAWDRTLMLYNVQVDRQHRLTYDKLFSPDRIRASGTYSDDEFDRRVARNAAGEDKLRKLFGEAF